MPKETEVFRGDERWAHFRFSVVGPLLASPPPRGDLCCELQRLASKRWRHPITQEWVRFGLSTLERWYYVSLKEQQDPVGALKRRRRHDSGTHPSMSPKLREALLVQYREHPDWTYQLHVDNLVVRSENDLELGSVPSYQSVCRFMRAHGLFRRPRRGPWESPGARKAEERFETREVRSYESEYVNALWHLDFHHGSVRVLSSQGKWVYPLLLGILDDHSRLCCHIQWYLTETAEILVHGLSQAFLKRGLPRALMTDNGSAMIAAETEAGLKRLGVLHETTLPYSPYQNGKQESFWGHVEGRLAAMLKGEKDLSLAMINEATLAWVEMEYNRKRHSETGATPIHRFCHDKDVARRCPSAHDLERAFTAEVARTQRRSDGTISLGGVRFEVPSRYAHLERVAVRFASWDLSVVYLCDPKDTRVLCRLYPQDKHRNAEGRRAPREPVLAVPDEPPSSPSGMAPLLRKLIAQYAATGLPPAYLPKETTPSKENESS